MFTLSLLVACGQDAPADIELVDRESAGLFDHAMRSSEGALGPYPSVDQSSSNGCSAAAATGLWLEGPLPLVRRHR